MRRPSRAVWSAELRVTVKEVPLVISTLVEVRVRAPPACPVMVSLETSMSLAAPLSLEKPVPVTTKVPVEAS